MYYCKYIIFNNNNINSNCLCGLTKKGECVTNQK